ncbi:hypothetical protein C9374_010336 [Naegleria lovaniensis]|uniref:Uncharacterized protein n=1 Tax=Naegleria lovaniensis TaxID=51637 RepID=A0AA88KJJ0_NAELO|nr:uncharacterized protein C9374_010336 [Naegleria lovaniensis]KAG2374962.1 hypothetical protein C9374_010336 [Naegleria lovaniensis]
MHVPYGKSIFFPIINVENLGIETCDFIKNVPGLVKGTDHYNLACVIVSMNLVESLSLEINGKKFNKEDLTRHRVISKKYKVTPAEGNIFGHPSVRTIARADGWWVMLENLKPGVYHIEFSGEIPNIFKLRTKYILTVAKKK